MFLNIFPGFILQISPSPISSACPLIIAGEFDVCVMWLLFVYHKDSIHSERHNWNTSEPTDLQNLGGGKDGRL